MVPNGQVGFRGSVGFANRCEGVVPLRRVLLFALFLPALLLAGLVAAPAEEADAQISVCLGIIDITLLGGPDGVDDDGDGDPCDDDQPDYDFDANGPSQQDNVVLRWNNQVLEAIRTTKPAPPVAARALAIVHTAMYDAWSAFDDNAVPTQRLLWVRQLPLLRTQRNIDIAISYAAERALADLFPTWRSRLDPTISAATGLLRALGYGGLTGTVAAVVGTNAANNVLRDRRNDGANQAGGYADTTGYQPVNPVMDLRAGAAFVPTPVSQRWQPLWVQGAAAPQRAAVPQFSVTRPFGIASPDAIPLDGPSSDPLATVDDILRESAQLDDRDKVIAEYWADGPGSEQPPGHWNLFAQVRSRQNRNNVERDVQLFFALNNALMDAGITAWWSKYRWDFGRPVTMIRNHFAGQMVEAWAGPYQGTRLIPGETWMPYQRLSFVTPGFPDYVSGHSTFSAAASTVLRRHFGSDAFNASVTVPVGFSFVEPATETQVGVPAAPVTLSWPTYTAAADEAGLSRRYGGIHWVDADVDGRYLGGQVGTAAYNRAERYWNGQTGGGLLGSLLGR